MEIAFHSLIHGFVIWLLVSSTFGDIALPPGYEPVVQPRYFPLHLPGDNYFYRKPVTSYPIPHFGRPPVPVPTNDQQSIPSNGYVPPQFVQPGLPGPPPNIQNQPSSLDQEVQRNRELQQKLSAQMRGLSQGYNPGFSQGYSQGFSQGYPGQWSFLNAAPVFPAQNYQQFPYISFYGQPSGNSRSYRSLPILQTRGYQIIKLQDLQNKQQNSWADFVDSGHDSGVNSQTHNSQHHNVAENSSIIASQTDLNSSTFDKKVDDYIVGSPLQIHKPQLLFFEQHHPVDIVNISDDFESTKNNSTEEKEEIKNVTENSLNFSAITDQMISNSSNTNQKFSTQKNSPIENSFKEVKSQFTNRQSSYKDYAGLSEAKNNDRLISNIKFPFSSERRSYNQPQEFEPESGLQRSYISQMDLINPEVPKLLLNHPIKLNNDFYNYYQTYPSLNMWQSPKFPVATFNYPYKSDTNPINKGSPSW